MTDKTKVWRGRVEMSVPTPPPPPEQTYYWDDAWFLEDLQGGIPNTPRVSVDGKSWKPARYDRHP